jgi:hypothetical protein
MIVADLVLSAECAWGTIHNDHGEGGTAMGLAKQRQPTLPSGAADGSDEASPTTRPQPKVWVYYPRKRSRPARAR